MYANNAGIFLVQTLFGLYILAVLLRFLLQWARADFYNPIVQFLVQVTNPPLVPLRRFIPGLMGLDLAAVVLMLALKSLELLLIFGIAGQSPSWVGLPVVALAELLDLLITVLFWAIIIRAILSWVNPDPRQPAVVLLYQLTEPILAPARNLIPTVGGLDLSPIAVLILLQLTKIVLIAPLWDTGRALL
jgi:YggT family protein